MSSWHSYGSIYNLGHRAVKELLSVPHYVEEKVDGSQFSFGRFDVEDGEPELRIRRKGCVMNIDAPEKMFNKAAETVKALASVLHPGWTYRGEYLARSKHNVLAYDRVPERHIILFDIARGEEDYLLPLEKLQEAQRIGLECVPLLATGTPVQPVTYDDIRRLLDTESRLGGQKIEGVVIKQFEPSLFGLDKKLLMGKFVSEALKEVHGSEWRKANPTRTDIVDALVALYCTPARWNKAVQHLREAGKLDGSPRDIGAILKEAQADIERECREEIQGRLYAHFSKAILRGAIAGLPEWYKEQLLKAQFADAVWEGV